MKTSARRILAHVRRARATLAVGTALCLAHAADAAAPGANRGVPGTPYTGFGRHTTGGEGKPLYHVTNLNDAGPGSLRDAVSRGDRCVVFDVAGDIILKDESGDLAVKDGNLTIDGFTAPAPGITLRKFGIGISANNVIVRGIRIYESDQRSSDRRAKSTGAVGSGGGVIVRGAHHVVIDHVSTGLNGNYTISATRGAYDVTISNTLQFENNNINLPEYRQLSSIFGPINPTNDPVRDDTRRISYHHNLIMNGGSRNPKISFSARGGFQAKEITADVRNNLVWGFLSSGTDAEDSSMSNVVGNYYHSTSNSDHAIIVDSTARSYLAGNVSGNGVALNDRGSESAPFPAEPIGETDAATAAAYVRANAGARGPNFGLSDLDRKHIDQIPLALPGVAARPSPTVISRIRLAIGNRIEATREINMHSAPASNSRATLPTFVATLPEGAKGRIVSGPKCEGNWWYLVKFDSGREGWVLGNYILRASDGP